MSKNTTSTKVDWNNFCAAELTVLRCTYATRIIPSPERSNRKCKHPRSRWLLPPSLENRHEEPNAQEAQEKRWISLLLGNDTHTCDIRETASNSNRNSEHTQPLILNQLQTNHPHPFTIIWFTRRHLAHLHGRSDTDIMITWGQGILLAGTAWTKLVMDARQTDATISAQKRISAWPRANLRR